MRRWRFLALLGVAAATVLAAPSNAAAAPAPAVQRDWTGVVAMTPEGGFRMGNPDAPVKLVEYGSLTCPHCATFAAAAMTELRGRYVTSGRVSFEYRNFVLNGIDVAASLLARCGGAETFFPVADALYARQEEWTGRIAGLDDEQKERLNALPPGARLARLAEIGGLSALAAGHGVTAQRGKACLADEEGLDRLAAMAEAASALGVQGTPTFFINGEMVEAYDWATLEPLIRQAGG
jgi:protein-disulfide isomerase